MSRPAARHLGARRDLRRASSWLALLFACLALGACAVTASPSGPPAAGPIGPVFVVHGVWPDHEGLWVDDVVEALRRRGVEGLAVRYATFVPGYLLDYGTDEPAERIAQFAAAVSDRHRRTGCRAPLRWCGIGFSAGTATLAKAAGRGVPFRLLYFSGCPMPAWSSDLTQLVESGQVERLVNYYSPIDPVVLWTAGSGVWGFRASGAAPDRVENRLAFNLHWPVFWTGELERVVDEITAAAEGEAHTCYDDPAYLAWYVALREQLRTGLPQPVRTPGLVTTSGE